MSAVAARATTDKGKGLGYRRGWRGVCRETGDPVGDFRNGRSLD